eukprot:TRINITY_DN473_c0_g1_i3.p1 TRINITY_DN473_c0_g1~~TRINITY_DN473_c0_g1_i3.p1  ORF type:complete len:135 (+),score=50.45 TRINITY_DN473_c0_g1_i3:300-704(+)
MSEAAAKIFSLGMVGGGSSQKHKIKMKIVIGIIEVVNLPKEMEGDEIFLEWKRGKKASQKGTSNRVVVTKNKIADKTSTANFQSTNTSIVIVTRSHLDSATAKFDKKELSLHLKHLKPKKEKKEKKDDKKREGT